MKILWVVNTIFPYPAKMIGKGNTVLGGWMLSALEQLKKVDNTLICIVSLYGGKRLLKFTDGNIYYYLIPTKDMNKYSVSVTKNMKLVINEFKPDIIHVHGTEYPHSLSAINAKNDIKTIISIQGLVSECGKKEYYNASIDTLDIIKNFSLRDLIKGEPLLLQHYELQKKGKYEIEALKKCDNIIGRTTWDKAHTVVITREDKYYKCNETLRNSFYNSEWKSDIARPHSIFVSQAAYPLKGFHILLKASNILKKMYPDLKIYVAGTNIIKKGETLKEKLKLTGYGKYLNKLINKYDLSENIEFLGLLNENEMTKKMLNSNVFVQTSSIENSSNSLGEAMLLSMPIVASNVGGTSDLLKDKEEGYLYPFGDEALLAYYISDIFEHKEKAKIMGTNARNHALITHDKEKNTEELIKIYKEVINKK